MLSYIVGGILFVGFLAVVYHFLPENLKQLLRIRGKGIVKNGTKGSERAQDAVDQAVAKLPGQRKMVARLMTKAQRAQKDAEAKRTECEGIVGEIALARRSNGSPRLQETLKIKWKTAKDSIPLLDEAAKTAHGEAEEAQLTLDGFLETIQTSQSAVDQIASNEDLAGILRESAAFRQQAQDLKKGLGSLGKEQRESEDEVANARNENDLSKGSSTDRELEDLKRRAKAASADDELEKALAEHAAKK